VFDAFLSHLFYHQETLQKSMVNHHQAKIPHEFNDLAHHMLSIGDKAQWML
jgi:hypothetical protein